jgi:hypothetical protein
MNTSCAPDRNKSSLMCHVEHSDSSMNQNRPATSKARGTCRYYNHPRGCYAGDKCKFLHADPAQHTDKSNPLLTPYDQAKRCKFYANGMQVRYRNQIDETHINGQGIAKEETSVGLCMTRVRMTSQKGKTVASALRSLQHMACLVRGHFYPSYLYSYQLYRWM